MRPFLLALFLCLPALASEWTPVYVRPSFVAQDGSRVLTEIVDPRVHPERMLTPEGDPAVPNGWTKPISVGQAKPVRLPPLKFAVPGASRPHIPVPGEF